MLQLFHINSINFILKTVSEHGLKVYRYPIQKLHLSSIAKVYPVQEEKTSIVLYI